MLLTATVKDPSALPTGNPLYDPYPGDIRNATVSFVDRGNNNAVIATVPISLINASDTTVGTATFNWKVTITANPTSYLIGMIVNNY